MSDQIKVRTVDPEVVSKEIALEKVRQAFNEYGPDYGPQLDDLSARAINRMGGWLGFCQSIIRATRTPDKDAGEKLLEKIKQDFYEYFEEFKNNKLHGQYQTDKLPWMMGTDGERQSYRLLFKSKDPEVQARILEGSKIKIRILPDMREQ